MELAILIILLVVSVLLLLKNTVMYTSCGQRAYVFLTNIVAAASIAIGVLGIASMIG